MLSIFQNPGTSLGVRPEVKSWFCLVVLTHHFPSLGLPIERELCESRNLVFFMHCCSFSAQTVSGADKHTSEQRF